MFEFINRVAFFFSVFVHRTSWRDTKCLWLNSSSRTTMLWVSLWWSWAAAHINACLPGYFEPASPIFNRFVVTRIHTHTRLSLRSVWKRCPSLWMTLYEEMYTDTELDQVSVTGGAQWPSHVTLRHSRGLVRGYSESWRRNFLGKLHNSSQCHNVFQDKAPEAEGPLSWAEAPGGGQHVETHTKKPFYLTCVLADVHMPQWGLSGDVAAGSVDRRSYWLDSAGKFMTTRIISCSVI